MSKLIQIEKALISLEGGKFQRIVDAYISFSGYGNIHSWGSVQGSDKTKIGTPDSFIQLENDLFIFIEYTTQQNGVFEKFKEDFEKCFDEKKTGVPVEKIYKIIVCCNTRLGPSDLLKLGEECKKHNCLFEAIDLSTLAFGLLQKCPHIAKDHLGIEVDTGQILPHREFILTKNKYSIPLNNVFLFREDELIELEKALSNNNIIIISGKPGSGKTKLALEAMIQYQKNNINYELFCIENKSLPIYEDLKSYFLLGRNYIILVDDANRITQLQQILSFTLRERYNIKLILTVRDYAYKELSKLLPAEAYFYMELQQFDRLKIDKILSSPSFNIRNPSCLDRIGGIAKGNPRLAIMAAKVVIETNDCSKLSDASSIYDSFFYNLMSDAREFQDKVLLRVLTILSYFRVIDNKTELFSKVLQVFELEEADFWEKAISLHELEIVDLYEHQICKITDQIQANYFFYRFVIKDQLVPFELFFNHFFLGYEKKMRDSIVPMANTFDFELLKNRIEKTIAEFWEENKNDEDKILRFADVFWIFRSIEILNLIYEQVQLMPSEAKPDELSFKDGSHTVSDKFLSILQYYKYSIPEEYKLSIEIILEYVKKRPSITDEFVSYVKRVIGFDFQSYRNGYIIQIEFFKCWIQQLEKETSLSPLFLHVACDFLKTKYEDHLFEGNKVYFRSFNLILDENLKKLRGAIIKCVFDNANQKEVYIFLETYTKNARPNSTKETLDYDSSLIISNLKQKLDPQNYRDAKGVQEYVYLLETNDLMSDKVKELRELFHNKLYNLSKILIPDRQVSRHRLKEEGLSWDQIEEKQQEEFLAHFIGYTYSEYIELIEQIQQIINPSQGQEFYRFQHSLSTIFIEVMKNDRELFLKILLYIERTGNRICFQFDSAVWIYISLYPNSHKELFELLNRHEYYDKERWLQVFYEYLPHIGVEDFYYSAFLEFLKKLSSPTTLRFDLLKKFELIDPKFTVNILRILFDQVHKLPHDFSHLFHPNELSDLPELFSQDLKFFKELYFYQLKSKEVYDDHKVFEIILHLDKTFIVDYLQFIYSDESYISDLNDHRNYSFIWNMANHEEIIESILDFYLAAKEQYYSTHHYINVFFRKSSDNKVLETILLFFEKYIIENINDISKIELIFVPIINIYSDHLKKYCEIFLTNNADFQQFKMINLEPSFLSSDSDSFVPVYESRIELWESLLPILNSTKFIQHRVYVTERIKELQYAIHFENRRIFLYSE